MDVLQTHDLIRLADQRGGTRISIFLPTHRGGPQTERNRIRLKNPDVIQSAGENGVVVDRVQVGPGHGLPGDAQLAGDRRSRDGVVAGDHSYPDAGGATLGHGLARLGAGRVDDTH
jgi:hypothetical protein